MNIRKKASKKKEGGEDTGRGVRRGVRRRGRSYRRRLLRCKPDSAFRVLRKRGFIKSPHGIIYKDYKGDLTVSLTFENKHDVLGALVLNYVHPKNIVRNRKTNEIITVRQGFVITKYSGPKHSLLTNLKNIHDKGIKKRVKNDLDCLWKIDK